MLAIDAIRCPSTVFFIVIMSLLRLLVVSTLKSQMPLGVLASLGLSIKNQTTGKLGRLT
jgi:hypothetical protein